MGFFPLAHLGVLGQTMPSRFTFPLSLKPCGVVLSWAWDWPSPEESQSAPNQQAAWMSRDHSQPALTPCLTLKQVLQESTHISYHYSCSLKFEVSLLCHLNFKHLLYFTISSFSCFMSLVKLLLIKAQHDVDPYVVRICCEVFIGNVTTVYDGKKNVSFVASDSVCREEEYLQLLR